MSIRIFPVNANENPVAVHNRSTYLQWLNFEQNSLSEYIHYSHPPYQIAGESVSYIDQNNKHTESDPEAFSSNDYLWTDENKELPPVYCVAGLKYHQGLYNKFLNAKIYYGSIDELRNDKTIKISAEYFFIKFFVQFYVCHKATSVFI